MSIRMGKDMELALALEGRTKAARKDTTSLLVLAGNLALLPDPVIDPAFASSLEATLLGEYDAIFASRPKLSLVRSIPEQGADEAISRAPVVQMPRRRHAVRRSLVAVAAAASLAALPIAASASSLPGDALHGLKRGMESANISFFGTPLEDGFYRMELSHRRATELTQLVALGGSVEDIATAARMARDELIKGQALVFANTSDIVDLTRLATMAKATEDEVRRAGIGGRTVGAPVIETSEQIQASVAEAIRTATPSPSVDAAAVPVSADQVTGAKTPTSPTTGSKATTEDAKRGSAEKSSDKSGPSGTAKNVSDAADDGCEVVGAAQGLGDFLTVVTRATCD